MPEQTWINLLIQVPLVGVFIWFSIYNMRQFLDALDKRDIAYEKRNTAIVESITRLNESICNKLDHQKPRAARKNPA